MTSLGADTPTLDGFDQAWVHHLDISIPSVDFKAQWDHVVLQRGRVIMWFDFTDHTTGLPDVAKDLAARLDAASTP
jgi:hypothetical protein